MSRRSVRMKGAGATAAKTERSGAAAREMMGWRLDSGGQVGRRAAPV
jgi:hypothetical protein